MTHMRTLSIMRHVFDVQCIGDFGMFPLINLSDLFFLLWVILLTGS